MRKRNVIFTIGHSTRTVEDFIRMIEAYGIKKVIDIRTIPKSRFNPQFNNESLEDSLSKEGIAYEHMQGLGGLRRPNKHSVNGGWRNASFRGYADYMQTQDFENGLKELIKEAQKQVSVIMCAEAVPWRCHRSLVADALLTRGFEVRNILSMSKAAPHQINPMAHVSEGKITYPGKDKRN